MNKILYTDEQAGTVLTYAEGESSIKGFLLRDGEEETDNLHEDEEIWLSFVTSNNRCLGARTVTILSV